MLELPRSRKRTGVQQMPHQLDAVLKTRSKIWRLGLVLRGVVVARWAIKAASTDENGDGRF